MQKHFHGLPAHGVQLDNGDTVWVTEQGAQVVSWVCRGRERLYFSAGNACDGQTPLRGGVPVCFPQFNQRGPLPKHGFVRNMPWALTQRDPQSLTFTLRSSPETLQLWPVDFVFALSIRLAPDVLHITLDAHNTGQVDASFTGALHTYLAVQDVRRVSLEGLEGQAEWDALRDVHQTCVGTLHGVEGFDRVYSAPPQVRLVDGPHRLLVQQSASWANTVVWNPGPDLPLPDMPRGDFAKMLCVEAAQVFEPVVLPAGQSWQGSQRLQVES